MIQPKRILVCGGRNYKDRERVFSVLSAAVQWFDINFVIIEGGATGPDWYSKEWAHAHGHPCIEMKAAWDFYGQGAGAIRNQLMLTHAMPDLLIAFPGGTGTRDMIARCKKAGVTV